jgi:hypothetical protein
MATLICNTEELTTTTVIVKTTVVTCEGGLLSPLYRLLFGASVVHETSTILETKLYQKDDLSEFEWELIEGEATKNWSKSWIIC